MTFENHILPFYINISVSLLSSWKKNRRLHIYCNIPLPKGRPLLCGIVKNRRLHTFRFFVRKPPNAYVYDSGTRCTRTLSKRSEIYINRKYRKCVIISILRQAMDGSQSIFFRRPENPIKPGNMQFLVLGGFEIEADGLLRTYGRAVITGCEETK